MDWSYNENKKVWIIGSVIAAIIIAAVIGWYAGRNSATIEAGLGSQAGSPLKSQTRKAVAADVVVPGKDSDVSANIAKPQVVAQASPDGLASFRSFSISVSGNRFSPDTVIVNVGDTVHLNIKAVDKDYDFYQPDYGLSKSLPKGVSTLVEFQASAGDKYTFYCKTCGGPNRGPVGYVVVVPKK